MSELTEKNQTTFGSSRPALLSAAVVTASSFWGMAELERSLCYNLLLEPDGIAIPDAFAFSPLLLQHIDGPKWGSSWFEEALSAGLVQIVTRRKEIQGFVAIRDELKRNDLLGIHNTEKAGEVARRLDNIKAVRSTDWPVWPDNMGIAFGDLVDKKLTVDRDTINTDGPIAAFLRRGQSLILDDVEVARSAMSANAGLRVSEIVKATASRLAGGSSPIRNVDELLDYVNSNCDAATSSDTYNFYKIITDLYTLNQATAFGALHSVPVYNRFSSLFLDGVSDVPFDDADDSYRTFSIRLPGQNTLMNAGFDLIKRARSSDKFVSYAKSLKKWRDTLSDEARDDMLDGLEAYLSRVRELIGEAAAKEEFEVGVSGSWSKITRGATSLATAGAAWKTREIVDSSIQEGMLVFAIGTVAKYGIDRFGRSVKKRLDKALFLKKVGIDRADLRLGSSGSLEVLRA